MLLLRRKTVTVDNHPVTLYSFDSRTWFSKPVDFKQFKQRRRATQAAAVKFLSVYDGSTFASSVDFWGR